MFELDRFDRVLQHVVRGPEHPSGLLMNAILAVPIDCTVGTQRAQ
jgi:hypothetical protein